MQEYAMNDPINDLEHLTEEEIKGFEIYRRKHITLYPPPPKPNPTKQGWEFKAYFIVSVAAVLLASMRTAEQFYRAATFSANPILGFIEAFLAVFTVETGIVVYAAVIAARRKKISQWVMWVGIILLASISIVAGLGQSLYLSSDLDPSILKYTEYMLSLLIGPGASIAALIGGHILGQQISASAQAYEQANAEYELEMEQYNDKVIRAWQRSVERKIVLGLVSVPKAAMQEFEVDQENESPMVTNLPEPPPMIKNGPVATVNSVKVDGGNHRQNQIPPVSMVFPKNQSSSPSQTIDPKITRIITQWLINSGKTPFDNDINIGAISKDTKIDTETIRSVLLKMRHARPVG